MVGLQFTDPLGDGKAAGDQGDDLVVDLIDLAAGITQFDQLTTDRFAVQMLQHPVGEDRAGIEFELACERGRIAVLGVERAAGDEGIDFHDGRKPTLGLIFPDASLDACKKLPADAVAVMAGSDEHALQFIPCGDAVADDLVGCGIHSDFDILLGIENEDPDAILGVLLVPVIGLPDIDEILQRAVIDRCLDGVMAELVDCGSIGSECLAE